MTLIGASHDRPARFESSDDHGRAWEHTDTRCADVIAARYAIAKAALEAIKGMGRVCKDYDTCRHAPCADSCGAALTAINALDEIAKLDGTPE